MLKEPDYASTPRPTLRDRLQQPKELVDFFSKQPRIEGRRT
jgi:hypothetical protein